MKFKDFIDNETKGANISKSKIKKVEADLNWMFSNQDFDEFKESSVTYVKQQGLFASISHFQKGNDGYGGYVLKLAKNKAELENKEFYPIIFEFSF